MRLKKAIKILIKELKKADYYYSWQANIAMAFKDRFYWAKKKKKYLNSEDIHKIANDAAKDFLNLLMKVKEEDL